MDNKNEFYQDEFIGQWLSGNLPAIKQQAFEKWLEENPEEKKYFKKIENIWKTSKHIKLKPGISLNKRWDRIADELCLQPEKKRKILSAQFRWKFASVAAVFILFFAASYFWASNRHIVKINVPTGSHQEVVLPNGSTITLNAETSLKYNKKEWQHKREITLTGEAFFKVTPGKPFTIKSDFVMTQVLGTSFNIKARDGKVEVACVTGKVSIQSMQKIQSPVILTHGLVSYVTKDNFPEAPYSCDINQKIGWISNQYYFTSTPLIEVLAEVQRQYRLKIIIQKENGQQLFTGMFEGDDIKKALDVICLSSGLQYSTHEKSTVFIK